MSFRPVRVNQGFTLTTGKHNASGHKPGAFPIQADRNLLNESSRALAAIRYESQRANACGCVLQ